MNVPVCIAAKPWQRLVGLWGNRQETEELLIIPCCDIHTIGMRRAIDVAFIDATGCVLESWRKVAPYRRIRNRKAVAVIERYAKEGAWFNPGDSIQLSKITASHRRRMLEAKAQV